MIEKGQKLILLRTKTRDSWIHHYMYMLFGAPQYLEVKKRSVAGRNNGMPWISILF